MARVETIQTGLPDADLRINRDRWGGQAQGAYSSGERNEMVCGAMTCEKTRRHTV